MSQSVEVWKPSGMYAIHRDVESVEWDPQKGLTLTSKMSVNLKGMETGRSVIVYPATSVDHYVVKDGLSARLS